MFRRRLYVMFAIATAVCSTIFILSKDKTEKQEFARMFKQKSSWTKTESLRSY